MATRSLDAPCCGRLLLGRRGQRDARESEGSRSCTLARRTNMMALRGSLRIVKLDGHDASAASTYEVTFTLSHGAALTPHKCCGLGKLEEYLANFAIEAASL